MTAHPLFPANSYDSPEDAHRALGDRLMLGGRWWFYGGFARIILRSKGEALRGEMDDYVWTRQSLSIFRLIERCGGRFHLRGLENLQLAPEPLVIISNHMSTLETMIFPCLVAPCRRVTFVVKDTLLANYFFGPILRTREPIEVGRVNPRSDLEIVLREGTERLQRGISVIVFPQSTRQVRFDPEQFNSLGVKLARRAGVKILPATIKTDFWGNGRWIKEFGSLHRRQPIWMEFGAPRPVSGNGSAEHRQVVAFIQSRLQLWSQGQQP